MTVVHRIWFGPEPMRDELVQFGRLWETLGYDVQLWTEQNLPALQNQAIFDDLADKPMPPSGQPERIARYVQQADIVAYELVFQFGGIVANCDMEPLRPLDLVAGVPAWAAFEVDGEHVCNAIVGADRPGHPFWQACIESIAERWPDERFEPMERVTGPGLITPLWQQRPGELTVFRSAQFYPFGFGEMHREWEHFPHAYTRHHWGHTRGR